MLLYIINFQLRLAFQDQLLKQITKAAQMLVRRSACVLVVTPQHLYVKQ